MIDTSTLFNGGMTAAFITYLIYHDKTVNLKIIETLEQNTKILREISYKLKFKG